MIGNIGKKFKETVISFNGKIAVKYKQENAWINLSYGDLNSRVESISRLLVENGITKNDRVAILAKNTPLWSIAFFGTVSLGAILVPINSEASSKEIENILNNSETKLIFLDAELLNLKKQILQSCPSVKTFIPLEPSTPIQPTKSTPGVDFKDYAKVEVLESDTACLLYTSGTTDVPKGVMLSHKNLLSNCDSLYRLGFISSKDSVVSVLPLHHTFPLTVTMLLPLLYGGTVVHPGTLRGETILQAMKETNPNVFVAVPQIFYAFHQKIEENLKKIPFPLNLLFKSVLNICYSIRQKTQINLARVLLGSIHKKFGKFMRFFISGGAKLDENIERDLFKLGFTILEGYGLTETSPVLSLNSSKKPKVGSVGFAIPDVELKIINKDENGQGEVIAHGPNIMKGYYKRTDLTSDVIKDGWFHTGDLGFFDKDGYLFLTGRSKDVIVLSSGKNIDPKEIEEAYLKEIPSKEICVFEVPARKGLKEGNVLWAVIVPDLEFFKKYGEVNLKNVIKERFDNVSRTLPAYERLMGFFITLEPFPRTLLGKMKRFAIKETYLPKIAKDEESVTEKTLSAEDQKLARSPLGKEIIDYLKEQTKLEKDISPGDSLELDLGIDSLGRVELALGLQNLFNAEIKDEVVGESFTVKDLIVRCTKVLLSKDVEITKTGKTKMLTGHDYWAKLLQVPPSKENLDTIDFKPGFLSWLVCFTFIFANWIIFKLFFSFKVEGRENFPKKGPYILYVNHTSYFDGMLVAASVPRFPRLDLFFVGFRPYFNAPIIRNFVKIGHLVPLDFASHLLEALKSCIYITKNGKGLCLFPEGLRTLDGNIGEFKKGFGILAKEAKAKLVPVILNGAFEAWPRTSKFPKRHPITVKYGKEISCEEAEKIGYALGAKDDYEAICLGTREILKKLKGQK